MLTYNTAVANDAGLLRQYLVERYARTCFLTGGLPGPLYRLMHRQVHRLTKLTGLFEDEVWSDLKADVLG